MRTHLAIAALALAACHEEDRQFREIAPAAAPATPAPARPDVRAGGPYDDNAWAVGEGMRLYRWYNCSGCHANGGGGMGPPLMDAHWIYGSAPEQIYATIVEGRPNGMPAYGGRIPAQQVWQLVAYVRSLSGLVPLPVRPGRSDSLFDGPPPSIRGTEHPSHPQTPPPAMPGAPDGGPRVGPRAADAGPPDAGRTPP